MKLTKRQLQRLIKEELENVLSELELDEFREPEDSVGNCTKGCIAKHNDFLDPANAVALAKCIAACVKNDPSIPGVMNQ